MCVALGIERKIINWSFQNFSTIGNLCKNFGVMMLKYSVAQNGKVYKNCSGLASGV